MRANKLQQCASLICLSILSCGEFDNSDLLEAIDNELHDNLVCDVLPNAKIQDLVLPLGVQDRPWAGWLHSNSSEHGTTTWNVKGLPDSIEVSLQTGELWGIPRAEGTYNLSITLQVEYPKCGATYDETTVKWIVGPKCEPDCNRTVSCAWDSDSGQPVAVAVYDDLATKDIPRWIKAGEVLARDGLSVESANIPLTAEESPSAGLTHKMVLWSHEAPQPYKITVFYANTGGVRIPIAGEQVDLRYLSGWHSDSYLFLTHNGSTRFVTYDGHLTNEEVAQRCPLNYNSHCSLPAIRHLHSNCEPNTGCNQAKVLPITVVGFDSRAGLKDIELLPGDSAEITNNWLFKLTNSYEQNASNECNVPSPVPYQHAYYMVPVGKGMCSYIEASITPLGKQSVEVGKPVSFSMNVIYPQILPAEKARWQIDAKWVVISPNNLAIKVPSTKYEDVTNYVFDTPGDYTVILQAEVHDLLKQVSYLPCGRDTVSQQKDVSAVRIVRVVQVGDI